VRTFGGEIPRVPGAAIKNTCLTVYIVLLGFSYRIFESVSRYADLPMETGRQVQLQVISQLFPQGFFTSTIRTQKWNKLIQSNLLMTSLRSVKFQTAGKEDEHIAAPVTSFSQFFCSIREPFQAFVVSLLKFINLYVLVKRLPV